ncbi:MAG TPA: MBL fold metallo-hydrolase [Frankiaceae bacterium]|nr:MBL fold metallo-hydrolase [Frankiaceae bacterium]
MSSKPFASSADLAARKPTLEEVADGVYAYTAEGDPNVGCVVGADSVLAVDARATPVVAQEWIEVIRDVTDKPVGYLVLTHYHAVRVLGASAFGAQRVLAHRHTSEWIEERGQQDRESELARFPRLFTGAESIPGLTRPSDVVGAHTVIDLGGRRVELRWLGRGHTQGDLVVWLPEERVMFAGDLVEAQTAPYLGDAYVGAWRGDTLDSVAALGAQALVPGRGPVVRGDDVTRAIEDTRHVLAETYDIVAEVYDRGGTLKQAYDDVHRALAPHYVGFPLFDHTLPFNVQRCWDEHSGIERPRIWTPARDRQVWDALTG